MRPLHYMPHKILPGQRGVALITSLIILVVLTLIGVTAINMTSLEEKMAYNDQERYRAEYSAESIIRNLATQNNLPAVPGGTEGGYSRNWILSSATYPSINNGVAQITYIQDTSPANLPRVSTTTKTIGQGGGVGTLPVFELYTSITSTGNTDAQYKGGLFFNKPQN